jgi:hypothetical protein
LHDEFWADGQREHVQESVGKLTDGEFFMSVEDFKDAFKSYTVVYLHESWKNSFIEKRNAVNKKVYKFNFSINSDHVSSAANVQTEETEFLGRPYDSMDLLLGEIVNDDGDAEEEEDEDDDVQAGVDVDEGEIHQTEEEEEGADEGQEDLA